MAAFSLPSNFLHNPGPKILRTDVDFKTTPLPEYTKHYAVILDNALTKEECDLLVRAAEGRTEGRWEQALVNVGMGMESLMTDTRDCGRIIWDDRDVVGRLWARIQDCVPELAIYEGRKGRRSRFTRLNERMRFLQYTEGQYFKPHMDGSYVTPDNKEVSYYTLHLYLTDRSSPDTGLGPLDGGPTTFHSWNLERALNVNPKIGRVLIFQHQGLIHSGADVLSGVKLTMRTDLMFEKEEE